MSEQVADLEEEAGYIVRMYDTLNKLRNQHRRRALALLENPERLNKETIGKLIQVLESTSTNTRED